MEILIGNIPNGYFDIFHTDIYTRPSRTVPNWLETKTDDHSKSQTEFTTGESDDE
jgi:hypothetical protein